MSIRPWGSSSVPRTVLLEFFALRLRCDGGGGGVDLRDVPESAIGRAEFVALGGAILSLSAGLTGEQSNKNEQTDETGV
jgi:hypothetical protein